MGGAAIEAIQLLLLNVAMLVVAPTVAVLLPAVTAARWPHIKIVGSLLAAGLVVVILSLDLPFGAQLTTAATQRSFTAEWVNAVEMAGIQVGLVTVGIAVSWLCLLSRLYPLDPAAPIPVRITLIDLVVMSFSIAFTSGYAAYAVAYWISSDPVTVEVPIAVAFLAFLVALVILSWVLRRYGY